MRLTHKHKDRGPAGGPRIAISQDEITADLNYRGGEPRRADPRSTRRGRR